MHITILTFDGFNELDSLIAFGILDRVKRPGWRVSIATPAAHVRSMNGLVLEGQARLDDASAADAVIGPGGREPRLHRTRDAKHCALPVGLSPACSC